MKRWTVLLIVVLLLMGIVATALPALSASQSQSVVPAVSTDVTNAAPRIACYPPPCDCPPDCR